MDWYPRDRKRRKRRSTSMRRSNQNEMRRSNLMRRSNQNINWTYIGQELFKIERDGSFATCSIGETPMLKTRVHQGSRVVMLVLTLHLRTELNCKDRQPGLSLTPAHVFS
uniref:Uncharacterized protein n=1 Tax=Cacopsylla melanoneura TaxID=428564 RepID=A0A8D9ELL8_9HEMI